MQNERELKGEVEDLEMAELDSHDGKLQPPEEKRQAEESEREEMEEMEEMEVMEEMGKEEAL